jgi:hypothetical protein
MHLYEQRKYKKNGGIFHTLGKNRKTAQPVYMLNAAKLFPDTPPKDYWYGVYNLTKIKDREIRSHEIF